MILGMLTKSEMLGLRIRRRRRALRPSQAWLILIKRLRAVRPPPRRPAAAGSQCQIFAPVAVISPRRALLSWSMSASVSAARPRLRDGQWFGERRRRGEREHERKGRFHWIDLCLGHYWDTRRNKH